MNFLQKALAAIAAFFKPKQVTTVATDTSAATVVTTTAVTTAPPDVQETDVQHAIDIVNNVKAALASPIAVLITDLIPGTIDDTIREELVNDLPIITAGLANVQNVIQTADKSAQMNYILGQIKLSPNIDLDAFYHSLAARLLTKVTTGGVIWSVAVMSVEYFFKNIFKAAPVVAAIAPVVQTAGTVASDVSAVAQAVNAPAAVQTDANAASELLTNIQNTINQ